MPNNRFVHLHLHSQYSLLDGAIQFKPLLDTVKKYGMDAVAVTDHGAMFGAMEFHKKAIEAGVRPIIGCEVYVATGSRHDKKPLANGRPGGRYHHLVLLVQNQKGYQNLCELVSAGYLEGYYYKPRIDKELLAKHCDGLITLSACIQGEVAWNIRNDKYDEAKKSALWHADIFPDRFYLEIQNHGMEEQKKVNEGMIRLARETGLPLVATNDAHYLNQEDAVAHDALLCIGTGKLITDEKRLRYPGDQFYVKSPEEMETLFGHIPEALENTIKIRDQIGFTFESGKYHLPGFPIPSDTTIDAYLEQEARHGLELRFIEQEKEGKSFANDEKKRYFDRLDMELEVICKMGFPGYFLITWNFIDYARRQDIPVGPGRGSAAGSMVSYALRITNLDPIKYGLIFERFLNPERISMPDIDIDFCMDRRGEVIDYVRKRYGGQERVCQIITFGTMKARAVVRDVARAMDIPYATADTIAKLIPTDLDITIDKALKQEPRLKKMVDTDKRIASLIAISRTLEGTTRHASTHAAGVVISPVPLTTFLPLFKSPNSEDVTTQFPMSDIESLGMLKMDFLGLRTLTVIDNAVKLIRKEKKESFDIEHIPLDDTKTFDLLARAKTLGVFQLESSGMRDLIRKMKPTTFYDIIALVALFRPGPINSGMADQYVRRKHGHEKVTLDFPVLKEVLEETYGVIVYQEQVMKIANVLSGFSMAQADTLRKAMGKKNADMMNQLRGQFIDGAKANKHNPKKTEALWNNIEKFGEYGFNKSHSACYALVAYQTAHLKAHYPAEYMAALITSEMGNSDKVIRYIQECRDLAIEVSPPDVNESQGAFTVAGSNVRFGVSAVKGVGAASVEGIIAARDADGPFTDVLDFCKRVSLKSLNKRVFEAIICCGGFDALHGMDSRSALLNAAEKLLSIGHKHQSDRDSGQGNLFGGASEDTADLTRILAGIRPWEEKEKLAKEKEALGFYISGHPLREYSRDLKLFANFTTATIDKAANKAEVHIGGLIIGKRIQTTKKKEMMAYLTLEDLNGTIDVLVWPDIYQKSVDLIDSEQPIFVKAEADVDDERGIKLIAQELMTFTEARARFTNEVHLRLSTTGLERETLDEIKLAFDNATGTTPVVFHFSSHNHGEVVMRSSTCAVTASEQLVTDLETIIGKETVFFQ